MQFVGVLQSEGVLSRYLRDALAPQIEGDHLHNIGQKENDSDAETSPEPITRDI